MGGQHSTKIDTETTHVLTNHGRGKDRLIALQSTHNIDVVTIDWVQDSFQKNERQDESMYPVADSQDSLMRICVNLTAKKLRSPHESLNPLFPDADSFNSFRGIVDEPKLNAILSRLHNFNPVEMASALVDTVKGSLQQVSDSVRINDMEGRQQWSSKPDPLRHVVRMLQMSSKYISVQAVLLKMCHNDHNEAQRSPIYDGAGTNDDLLREMNSYGQLKIQYTDVNIGKSSLCLDGEKIYDPSLQTYLYTGLLPTQGSVTERRMIKFQEVSSYYECEYPSKCWLLIKLSYTHQMERDYVTWLIQNGGILGLLKNMHGNVERIKCEVFLSQASKKKIFMNQSTQGTNAVTPLAVPQQNTLPADISKKRPPPASSIENMDMTLLNETPSSSHVQLPYLMKRQPQIDTPASSSMRGNQLQQLERIVNNNSSTQRPRNPVGPPQRGTTQQRQRSGDSNQQSSSFNNSYTQQQTGNNMMAPLRQNNNQWQRQPSNMAGETSQRRPVFNPYHQKSGGNLDFTTTADNNMMMPHQNDNQSWSRPSMNTAGGGAVNQQNNPYQQSNRGNNNTQRHMLAGQQQRGGNSSQPRTSFQNQQEHTRQQQQQNNSNQQYNNSSQQVREQQQQHIGNNNLLEVNAEALEPTRTFGKLEEFCRNVVTELPLNDQPFNGTVQDSDIVIGNGATSEEKNTTAGKEFQSLITSTFTQYDEIRQNNNSSCKMTKTRKWNLLHNNIIKPLLSSRYRFLLREGSRRSPLVALGSTTLLSKIGKTIAPSMTGDEYKRLKKRVQAAAMP